MSRLLSGASMEANSILLEHTLVLSGELVETGSVWQGWPCRVQVSLNEHRDALKVRLDQLQHSFLRELQSSSPTKRSDADRLNGGELQPLLMETGNAKYLK